MKTKPIFLLLGFGLLSAPAFAQTPADPVLSVTGLSTAQQTVLVTVTEATPGTTIAYTTDGSIPTTSSPTVASGSTLLVAQNATVQVQAFLSPTSTSSLITEKLALAGMVSAGTAHTLFLKNDGTVWASGDNSAGELGTGNTTPSNAPVQVMTNSTTALTKIVAVAAANNESFAVDANGNVWVWGLNTNGQLGIGTSNNTLYATQVTALGNMIGIAASGNHVVALRADGSVWGWGSNASGQVGHGTTSAWVTTPTQVLAPSGQSGNLTGIVAVAAGANHSLALTNGGKVYAWGSDSAGQLGNADTNLASQSLPVQVLRNGVALTNVVALAGGTLDSYALRADGTAWSWGDNTVGELGNGTTSPATPVNSANLSAAQVTGLTGTMAAIGNGSAFGNGTAFTWGDNTYGELGIGLTGSYATLPLTVDLTGSVSPSLAISSGNNQSVNNGSFTTPLTITATSSGSPVQNAFINFIVTQGGGFLATDTTSPQFSGILQVQTDVSGQASLYYQNPGTGQITSQVVATTGTGTVQDTFTVLTAIQQMASDTPTLPPWALVLMAVLFFLVAGPFRQRSVVRD